MNCVPAPPGNEGGNYTHYISQRNPSTPGDAVPSAAAISRAGPGGRGSGRHFAAPPVDVSSRPPARDNTTTIRWTPTHNLFVKCEAWRPRIRRSWRDVGKGCEWKYPRAPSVRTLSPVVVSLLRETQARGSDAGAEHPAEGGGRGGRAGSLPG